MSESRLKYKQNRATSGATRRWACFLHDFMHVWFISSRVYKYEYRYTNIPKYTHSHTHTNIQMYKSIHWYTIRLWLSFVIYLKAFEISAWPASLSQVFIPLLSLPTWTLLLSRSVPSTPVTSSTSRLEIGIWAGLLHFTCDPHIHSLYAFLSCCSSWIISSTPSIRSSQIRTSFLVAHRSVTMVGTSCSLFLSFHDCVCV